MKNLFLLLSPRLLSLKNVFASSTKNMRRRALIITIIGLVFWGLMFLLSSRVLIYFQSVEVIGDILAHHLLAMVLLTFFSLLIFSNIILPSPTFIFPQTTNFATLLPPTWKRSFLAVQFLPSLIAHGCSSCLDFLL